MIFTAFQRALAQLPEPAFRRVLLISVGSTAALFIVLLVLFGSLASSFAFFQWGWLNDLLAYGGIAVFFIVLLILFPAVSAVFISFFLDDIADAVEERYYPHDRGGVSPKFGVGLMMAIQYGAILLVLNIIALPFYILFIWFPPLSLGLYYLMNGYLLSREYFEMVSIRHNSLGEVKDLRKRNWRPLFFTGIGIAFLLTIPVVNLVTPLIATATMVHMLKFLESKEGTR